MWVIYTSPRVSQCHVARKWHITAANHAVAMVTRATCQEDLVLNTQGKQHFGSDAYHDPTVCLPDAVDGCLSVLVRIAVPYLRGNTHCGIFSFFYSCSLQNLLYLSLNIYADYVNYYAH